MTNRADDPRLAAAERSLHDQLERLWQRGWGPADAAHVTGRLLTRRHAAAVVERIRVDHDRRVAAGEHVAGRWTGEVDDLGAPRSGPDEGEVALLQAVVALLASLPSVAATMPRPGEVHADVAGRLDPRMLTRVRALLAKAESTEFEEEASAFMAKAQELIARHAIDEARLAPDEHVGEPARRRLHLDDPYLTAKASLVAGVAGANRCTVVQERRLGWVTVVGFERDLDVVELLSASLLSQATAAMLRQGSVRDVGGRSRTRSFRRAFLLGFAARIGVRLQQATEEEVARSAAVVPVLARRRAAVEAATKAAFPDVVSRRTTFSNGAGFDEGWSAADRARLDPSRPLREAGPS